MSRAEICPSFIGHISFRTPGLTSHWGSSESPWAHSSWISLWDWESPLSPRRRHSGNKQPQSHSTWCPFDSSDPQLSWAWDKAKLCPPTTNSTAGSYSTGPLPTPAEHCRTPCPCLSLSSWGGKKKGKKKGSFKLGSVGDEHSLTHVYPEQSIPSALCRIFSHDYLSGVLITWTLQPLGWWDSLGAWDDPFRLHMSCSAKPPAEIPGFARAAHCLALAGTRPQPGPGQRRAAQGRARFSLLTLLFFRLTRLMIGKGPCPCPRPPLPPQPHNCHRQLVHC